MVRFFYITVLAGFLGCLGVFADPSVSVSAGKATVSWSSAANTQYRVYATHDLSLPFANWDQVGNWFAGNGAQLSLEEAITATRFYVVEKGEENEFEIDVTDIGYSTIGNTWTYEIIDSRENNVPFDATYEIIGRESYQGDDAIKAIVTSENHPSVNDWMQTVYFLDDFSVGIYVLGGVNPPAGDGSTYNVGPYQISRLFYPPKWPILFNNFTLNEAVDADYHHSFYGDVNNTITHRITSYTLPGDTEPSTAIEVTSVFTANVSGVTVLSTTVDTFVDGVGLVAKQVDVVPSGSFAPPPISVSLSLTGYSQP